MFCGCSKLKELDLSNFNTRNVKNINYMFNKCLNLKKGIIKIKCKEDNENLKKSIRKCLKIKI